MVTKELFTQSYQQQNFFFPIPGDGVIIETISSQHNLGINNSFIIKLTRNLYEDVHNIPK